MVNTKAEEAAQKLTVEKLEKSFDVSTFDCGRASLNEWLKEYSWQNHAGDSARTYVVKKDDRVVGYYSLTAASIRVEEVVVRIAQGQSKQWPIAAIKLARLAVDQQMQGLGLGKALLKDALLRCINAADEIGARVVIVDALDENVRSFYENFDFVSGPQDQNMMMILMKDLRKAFDNTEP